MLLPRLVSFVGQEDMLMSIEINHMVPTFYLSYEEVSPSGEKIECLHCKYIFLKEHFIIFHLSYLTKVHPIEILILLS